MTTHSLRWKESRDRKVLQKRISFKKKSLELLKYCEEVCTKQDSQETFKIHRHGRAWLIWETSKSLGEKDRARSLGRLQARHGRPWRGPGRGQVFDIAQEVGIHIFSIKQRALSKDRMTRFVFEKVNQIKISRIYWRWKTELWKILKRQGNDLRR